MYSVSECNESFSEYLIEECLELTDPTPDAGEEDIKDIVTFAEDIDLLFQAHLSIIHPTLLTENLRYYTHDNDPVSMYLGQCTPPPEGYSPIWFN